MNSPAADLVARLREMPEAAREAWLNSREVFGFMRDPTVFAAACAELQPRGLPQLAERLLALSPGTVPMVQALIAAGLCARPSSEAYTLGLIALPSVLRDRSRLDALLDADPGLPAALLRVFSIEGTAETSLASSDKYQHPSLHWPGLLLSLVSRGATTREQLLELTLGALANDWPQYRSGWHSRFHAQLAPSPEEMRPHLPRYLALCASRIPPTVSLAVEVLGRLDAAQPLPGRTLVAALRPVFAGAVKAQVEAALKLLDRIVEREPELRGEAADAVAAALLLEAAPVQKALLQRLKAWGIDEALRAKLTTFGGAVAAVNRPAWQALVGAPAAAPVPAAPQSMPAPRTAPLDPARLIAPPRDDAALVELIAHAFEHETDVEAFEAAVAAIVGGAPFDSARRRRLGPVLKRAPKVRKPLPRLLARLLVGVVEQRSLEWQAGLDPGGNPSPAQDLLLLRIDALGAFARQDGGLPPLAAPTHRGGFVSPLALIERVAAHQARDLASEPLEQALALLRLAPGAGEAEREAARHLRDGPFVRALRYALGDEVAPEGAPELFAAAARIRHAGTDDELLLRHQGDRGPDAALAARFAWHVESRSSTVDGRRWHFHELLIEGQRRPRDTPPAFVAVQRHPAVGQDRLHFRWWSFGGWDEGSIAWSATLLPSDAESFCAEGALAIGNNLDWPEAQWHNAGYLRRLHDPTLSPGPMAMLLLALGMMGKEPGQTALAVDALVLMHLESRLDVPLLASTLRALLSTPLPKAARLAASLRATLRADAQLQTMVFALLAQAVVAGPPPRDVAALLDLLLELKLTLGAALPEATRAGLAAGSWSGRARTTCRGLLG